MVVEDFDGGGVDWGIVWGRVDFGYVGVGVEYVEGGIKGEIIDDVEGEVVELVEVVENGSFYGGVGDEVVELFDKEFEVGVNVGFELGD